MRTHLRYSVALLLLLAVNLPGQTRYYVDGDQDNDDETGLDTWSQAKKYLQSALALAADGDQIWVAAGVYYPDDGCGDNDMECSFEIPDGVKVYGGFAGSEENLEDRHWLENETILSGDIDQNDDAVFTTWESENRSGNAYHVVFLEDVFEETVLDGFTITSGIAAGGFVSDEHMKGGGIYNSGGSPQITNCIISGNYANPYGGGIYNASGSPTFTNCLISGNHSTNTGGGIYAGGSPIFTNCTITGNSGKWNEKGGIYCAGESLTLTNCIVWGNNNNMGPLWNPLFITYSNIQYEYEQQWYPEIFEHETNTGSDPMFVNAIPVPTWNGPKATGGNYRLIQGSPALDMGDNDAEHLTARDLDGENRQQDDDSDGVAEVDMGAYEGGEPPPPYFVDLAADPDGDGTSWENAFDDLQSALALADDGEQIWVAAGTYTSEFNVGSGIKIYGGFSGSEENLEERNWDENETILTNPDGTVVKFENVSEETVLDGFIISGGRAEGAKEERNGGGIYNTNGSPKITNCTITDNEATEEGGGIYNLGKGSGSDAHITLTNCTISNNTAKYGGGLFNKTEDHGVATYSLTNCTITGNYAEKDGGGIFNESPKHEGDDVESNVFLTNCTISGNRATRRGGGIWNHNRKEHGYANITGTNTIVWGNIHEGDPYGCGDCDNVLNDMGSIRWSHSIIEGSGGSDNWDGGFGDDDGNNMDEDPEFFEALDPNDAPSNDGDFHLTEDSPAIDSGVSLDVELPDLDLDGDPRIQGDNINMGAYETNYQSLDEEPPVMVSVCPDMENCPDAISDYSVVSDLILTLNEEMMQGIGTIVIMQGDNVVQSIVLPVDPPDADVTIGGEEGSIITIDPDNDFEANTEYSVEIPAGAFEDAAGNAFAGIPYTDADEEEISWRFIIDTEVPTVTFNPAAGSSGNAVDIDITLSFGEEVFLSADGSDLDNDNVDALITLKEDDEEGSDIDFDATVAHGEETIITVNPTDNFPSEQRVYVSIDADLRDVAGNVIAQSDVTFNIADVEAPDATFTPSNDATGVAPNTLITITLSEAVENGNGSAITDDNVGDLITLKTDDASGTDIDFTATINDLKQVITVASTSNFESEQVVYAALDAAIKDDAENDLSGSLNATFTVAVVTAPTVVISVDNSVVSPTSISPVSTTVTFDELVTGFALSDISVTNGDLSDFAEVEEGRVFSVDVTPSARKVTVSVEPDVASNSLGTGNAASNSLSFLYDATAPTVTYNPLEGAIDIAVDFSNIKFTFSKRVKK